ncbi:GAF and ANTAR domain-containing protein [Nocardioides donggukensis]|uniref:GAF and ANTAR domain-containing protein n=1 Tax=Nocardioides donggukensis TaxID=2774019 RepID=A0A927PZC2_9ACTN|nr:GAF and ANTAR domain-containing protein [Nocardioides donggukensis]MBD8868875.1 GAF and ANTAR domain-containing protein [Nocardioides donggukensis]
MAVDDGSPGDGAGLAESVAALGRFVVSEQSLSESLMRVAELSLRAVYGADGAGVTWVEKGEPTTVTAAGDFVRRIDEIQYALDEGPCLEAHATQQVVTVDDLRLERRWPRFTPAALDYGLRGVVAAPLAVRGTRLGALNIYALQEGLLDEAAAATATLFAEHAAVVLANAEAFSRAKSEAVTLGHALTSRAVIDMAKGIVMARRHCGSQEAFDHLRQLSQDQNRKLRDVAQDLVDEVAGETGHRADPAAG